MSLDLHSHYLIRAMRLLDPRLSGLSFMPERDSLENFLVAGLLKRNGVDNSRAATSLVRELLGFEKNPLIGLFALARKLVGFRDRQARCLDSELWQKIGFDLDTDLIIAARLAGLGAPPQSPSQIKSLCWPGVLAEDGLLSEVVTYQPLSDNHVHLGVPARYLLLGGPDGQFLAALSPGRLGFGSRNLAP